MLLKYIALKDVDNRNLWKLVLKNISFSYLHIRDNYLLLDPFSEEDCAYFPAKIPEQSSHG